MCIPKFGQVRPIVGVEEEDGTITIVAGNHQLKAAKSLGWTHVAVSVVDMGEAEAIEFALADNRVSDLGSDDPDLFFKMLETVLDEDKQFWEDLGIDEFDMAEMETTYIEHSGESEDFSQGFTPPEIKVPLPVGEDGEIRYHSENEE